MYLQFDVKASIYMYAHVHISMYTVYIDIPYGAYISRV